MLRQLKNTCSFLLAVAAYCLPFGGGHGQAQEPGSPATSEAASPQQKREAAFKDLLDGATLVGRFTLDGEPEGKLIEERYEIADVSKLDDQDLWGMKSRIKYASHDVTVPIAVQVQFAGDTPVIVLDELLIPGLGTFSARVLFDRDRYAGTWQHGDKGGHLFGRVEKSSPKGQGESGPSERSQNEPSQK